MRTPKHVAVVLFAVAGCGDVPTVAEADGVRVERAGNELTIRNGRDAVLLYFAVPEDLAHVIDWAPCTMEPWCPRVAPGAVGRHGLPPDTDEDDVILFYWWHAVQGEEGPIPDEIRLLEIG